jgi:hypothetical protein
MPATEFSEFHRWFVAKRPAQPASILLQGNAGLADAIACYLNEFDEESRGNWLAFAPELIELISKTGPQRALLGLDRDCENAPSNCTCARRNLFEALARHGWVVLDEELASEATSKLENVFRVLLGSPSGGSEHFHLILHPKDFSNSSLVALIADTYLEWANSRLPVEAV